MDKDTEIKGYVHPAKDNTNRQRVYKTFTEGEKSKKFGKTTVGGKYASYGDYDNKECSICRNLILLCKCPSHI